MTTKNPFSHEKYFWFKRDNNGIDPWKIASDYIEELQKEIPVAFKNFPESGNILYDIIVYECGNFIATCIAQNPDLSMKRRTSQHQKNKDLAKQILKDIEDLFRLLDTFRISAETIQQVGNEISYGHRAQALFHHTSLKKSAVLYQTGFGGASLIEGVSRVGVEAAADVFLLRLWSLRMSRILTPKLVSYLWIFMKSKMSSSKKGRGSNANINIHDLIITSESTCEKRRRDKKIIANKVLSAQATDYYNFLFDLRSHFPAELSVLLNSFEQVYCTDRGIENPTEMVRKMLTLSEAKS